MLCVSFLISQVTVSIATHSAVHCTMEASSFFVAVTRFRLGKYEISTTGKTEKITERICLFTSRQVHQSKETVWSVLFVGQSLKEKITQHKINHYFAVSSNSRARMAIEVEEWIELWVKIKISISNHSPKTVENVQLKFSFFLRRLRPNLRSTCSLDFQILLNVKFKYGNRKKLVELSRQKQLHTTRVWDAFDRT